jgi:hypothetical protein
VRRRGRPPGHASQCGLPRLYPALLTRDLAIAMIATDKLTKEALKKNKLFFFVCNAQTIV